MNQYVDYLIASELDVDNGFKLKNVLIRPLRSSDYKNWHEVRFHSHAWLVKWEPRVPNGKYPDLTERAFLSRLSMMKRERQIGSAYGFGIFLNDNFIGEVNLSNIQRGAMQSATIGYWIDQRYCGKGFVPEATVGLLKFAFEMLNLHRIEILIVPTNKASLRVAEKLELRCEGITKDYLIIDGNWEDHARFAILDSEWSSKTNFYGKFIA
jgi:ribosomal-protein-alanine N-acetyltransferase